MVTRPSSRKALPGGAATRCGPVSTAGGRGGQGELATAERRHGPLTLPLRGPLPLPRGEREIYLLSQRVTFSPGGRGLRSLGEALGAVAADVAGHLAAAGRMADEDRVFEVPMLDQRRQVVGVGIHPVSVPGLARSEERRVGKECVSKCRSRWSPCN